MCAKGLKLTTAKTILESSAIAISLARVRSPHQLVEAGQLVHDPGTPGCFWNRVTDRPLLVPAATPSSRC